MNIKTLRLEQLSLSEVEFEWIRQYYVQGSLHHELHTWWHAPMIVLMDLWMRLEQRTQIIIQALRDAAGKHAIMRESKLCEACDSWH